MSKILIVEDEESIADLEKDYLELSGFEVEIENQGDTGLVRAVKEDFDLLILDLMLPEVDGFEICREVREKKDIPIIMVSAKKDDIDKIRGLGLGADDYMTKPFSPSELVARVKAHLARYDRLVGNGKKENDVVEIRGIKIDKTARRVWVNGEEKQFTTKEFDLLTFLAENPNRVFTKVTKGMIVKVKFDVYGDEEFEGKVSLVYPTIDAATHTFPVEVKLANTRQRIRPGMFGRVTVSFGTLRHVVVPDQAIVKRAGSGDRYVYVYKDGKVSYNKVELGRRMGTEYELISGVEDNSQVVVAGQTRLADGVEVAVN